MIPAPNRRWSFSLRTLFVVVTVPACWSGWNIHRVAERKRLIQLPGVRVYDVGTSMKVGVVKTLWSTSDLVKATIDA